MSLRIALALFLTTAAYANTVIELPAGAFPAYAIGLAAGADGTIWYATWGAGVGRVLPTGEVERVQLPAPFAAERSAPIAVAPNGTAYFAGLNAVIGKVDRQMRASLIAVDKPLSSIHVLDIVAGADGAIWFIADGSPSAPFLGRLDPANDAIQRFPLPATPSRMTIAPDGSMVVALSDGIYRAATSGGVDRVVACACTTAWLEVTPDGGVWMSGGRIPPGADRVAPFPYGGWDAAVDANGNVWVASLSNAVEVFSSDGSLREIPLALPRDIPRAIVFARGAIWYSVNGAIRSIDPDRPVDLRLRRGDLITVEQEQNCCFEGTHAVLAVHRRGPEPFLRRIERRRVDSYTPWRSSYAVSETAVVVDASDIGEFDMLAMSLFDGVGNAWRDLRLTTWSHASGIVVGGDGTISLIRRSLEDGTYRVLSVAADGTLMHDLPVAIPRDVTINAVDLASDQCTLFYAGHRTDASHAYHEPVDGFIGRANLCTGAALEPFVTNLPDIPLDLRLTRDGSVLVVGGVRLVTYDASGAIVRELKTGAWNSLTALALDLDPRYLWVASWRDLVRIDAVTGAVVERLPIYGGPTNISVVGEPRAARFGQRRRAVSLR
ncbi:MAG TPA: hypothetical protein VND45_02775 [Thermoanaerobaculia bacterium]|nr:hypothetical protein [Thermoanaerobaculia bacterium]